MVLASTNLQVSIILFVVADGASLILLFLLDLLAVILLYTRSFLSLRFTL